MSDNATKIFQQVPGLSMTDVPDGSVVCDAEGSQLHFLNPTAAAVLLLCDGSLEPEKIAQILMEEFLLSSPPLQDVNDCIEDLQRLALVVPVGEKP